jgi:hypothetical protein
MSDDREWVTRQAVQFGNELRAALETVGHDCNRRNA